MSWIRKYKINIFKDLIYLKEKKRNNRLEKVIRKLDYCSDRDLNYVVSCLLEEFGYECQFLDDFNNEQGIDIIGQKQYGRNVAVKCVARNIRSSKRRISKRDVQAFKGSYLSNSYKKGILVTNSYFSKSALEEGDDKLLLVDRRTLYLLLTTYFPQSVANAYYKDTLEHLKKYYY